MHGWTRVVDPMTATETREALSEAYDDVVAGLRAGDLDLLRARVAEDCRIVGPKGFLIGRTEWIESHDGSVFEQISLETVESEVLDYGPTAVRLDLQESECLFKGERISGAFRVLSVWRDKEPGWQLTLIQYTAATPEALAG